MMDICTGVTKSPVFPTGLLNLRHNKKYEKKIMTLLWRSNHMFHYMFEAEFVTLASFKKSRRGYRMASAVRPPTAWPGS